MDNTGPFFSTIDRIDYSNDTAATSPKGPLSSVRDSLQQQVINHLVTFGGDVYFYSIISRPSRLF